MRGGRVTHILTAARAMELSTVRDRQETEIERLIALLDVFDGDPTLNPIWRGLMATGQDDREGDDIDSVESDGLENGEFDYGEQDSGGAITGGAYYL